MTDLVRTTTEWFIEAPAIVWIIAAVIAVAAIARGKLRYMLRPGFRQSQALGVYFSCGGRIGESCADRLQS